MSTAETRADPAPEGVAVRPRRPDDLPALVEVVAEQQPRTRYPYRWPLPSMSTEEFLARDHEVAGWVAADLTGPIGHVAVTGGPGSATNPAWAGPAGRPVETLGVIGSLVVATRARRGGVGGLLLQRAVQSCHEAGLVPILDVLPVHPPLFEFYAALGWREIGRVREDWQPPETGDMVLMMRQEDLPAQA